MRQGPEQPSGPQRRPLPLVVVALVVVGVVIRLTFAASTDGNVFDLRSYVVVADGLRDGEPFDLYATVNDGTFPRWPYLPGYLPVVLVAGWFDGALDMARSMRLPPIAADVAIAFVVAAATLRRTASRTSTTWAAGAVALGPVFILLSGHHGQLDSVAILPAVLSLAVRRQRPDERGDIWCGLLLGCAIALKTTPAILLLAFVPAVPSAVRRVRLLAAAAAVPAITVLPFVLTAPGDTIRSLTYKGLPGLGGWSLLVQPSAAADWLGMQPLQQSALTELTQAVAPAVLLTVLAATAMVTHARGLSLEVRCLALWAAFFAASMNFSLGYVVWALPFVLLAGHVRAAWWIQVALLPAAAAIYLIRVVDGWPEAVALGLYVPYMGFAHLVLVLGTARYLMGPPAAIDRSASRASRRPRLLAARRS